MSGVEPGSRGSRATSLRRVTSLFSITLLALASGLTVAACGGDEQLSRGEYERELQETAREIETARADVGSELRNVGTGSASLDQEAERADAVRDRLAQEADELAAMEPPDDAEQAHAELVEGLNGLAEDLGGFRTAIESGDVQQIQQLAHGLQELDSVRQIERARRELEAQGYDLSG